MSPASKSKSKSKEKAAKGAKENQKSSVKASGSANNGNGSLASAYDPLSGTFHNLEAAPVVSSLSPHSSGRFRNIDGTLEHPVGLLGTATEYDSVSNNGSCSNESEDHKERNSGATLRQEPIPGSDNDKREKIRQKNEKKHQRQKEKRAQELHGKCCNYLMSRKLEMLSQQLVAMGFSPERVTMALMLNEGRVEDSVSWLVESEKNTENIDTDIGSGNLRLDISEELAQITAMEVKYNCSKQEVERAVVACQGDLEKAEETLKEQKQEALPDPPKLDESIVSKNLIKPQEKPTASVPVQERKIERDFNYTKVPAKPSTNSNFSKVPASVITPPEPGNRNLLLLKTNQAKVTVDKRWTNVGSSPASYPLASPLQATLPSTKVDARQRAMVSDCKNIQEFQQGAIREPVIMLQRPNSINAKQNLVLNATALPAGTSGWYPNNVLAAETMRPNGKVLLNQVTGNLSSEPFYHQNYLYKNDPFVPSSPLDSRAALLGGLRSTVGAAPPSPSLSVPSSVGLFSGWGSSSSVGWDTGGSMPQCDYTSIDWTLESSNSLPSKFSGLGLGITSPFKDGPGMTPVGENGVHYVGLQDGGLTKESHSSAGSHEWTSPFAGNDIFSVPRHVVSSSP
ncbi:hypothetical protein RJ641_036918 [Dillenia turbinata]|uniref:UBA domain-containing protein n=1 Tax=Dillenia turbinata TaxID=194707 RepID=A0AAN8VLW8_9MAGN